MSDSWFIQRGDEKFGPYSPAQLKQMTATGHLLPVDLVAKGESGKWVPATQIKGLFATSAAKPATPPNLPDAIQGPPPLPTRVLPPPLPISATLRSGPPPLPTDGLPPPLPTSSSSYSAVEIADRKAIPTNPVALALLSGLIIIPVGHLMLGQVLKAVVIFFTVPWLLFAVGFGTQLVGVPFVMLVYAVVMGTDAYLLALKRSAGEPIGPWDTPVVGKLLGAKQLLPARIAMPILGMLVVVGSSLCLSLVGVAAAIMGHSDLKHQMLFALFFFHSLVTVVAIVFTARLQYHLAALAAAGLTIPVWGWLVFTNFPPIVWVLGLMAGTSIGGWALFTFRSLEVKSLFADGDKPSPLDRFGLPVFAAAAGGLLVFILCIGGVLHLVARDQSMDRYTNTDSDSRERQWKEREMAPPRQMKERTMKSRLGDSYDDDDYGMGSANKEITAEQLENRSLAQIKQLLGAPTEIYQSKKRSNQKLAIWATGNDKYAVVGYLESIDGSNQILILSTAVNRTRSIVENMKRASDK